MTSHGNFHRLICLSVAILICPRALGQTPTQDETAYRKAVEGVLAKLPPGTKPLTLDKPLDEVMVDGIQRFALREIESSVSRRGSLWNRDYSSLAAYEQSVAPNRERLKTIIGAVDPRVPATGLEFRQARFSEGLDGKPFRPEIARIGRVSVIPVRFEVLPGITTEGLLLVPGDAPSSFVVAIPDADWTPEMFAGVVPGLPPESQLANRLARHGAAVYVPALISRDDTCSGHPDVRYTNQSHREFVYRQAYPLGRHVIGYEVQKVCAAIDQFVAWRKTSDAPPASSAPLGVVGVGEGGLLALYAAAVDPRIDVALVSGYFGPRESVWQEPLYRNVWGLLHEFGDAEIASLIAPRRLVIERSAAPEVVGAPPPKPGRSGGAAPGRIALPAAAEVQREFDRARALYDKLPQPPDAPRLCGLALVNPPGPPPPPGGSPALKELMAPIDPRELPDAGTPAELSPGMTTSGLADLAAARQKRQVEELVEHTQRLLARSARVRDELWRKADRSSPQAWDASADSYRKLVHDELIGRLPEPTMAPDVRTRLVLDEPEYRGFEVVLDVYPDVIAGGILLLPKDLKEGERRPVVVCQHGLEGTPLDTIRKDVPGFQFYAAFAAELARRGFITYAPQNPYRGQDRFRLIQRLSNPLRRSLYSYILPQHQRTLDWLASLPQVDPQRIAFYGLSYGGKTAVHVPPLLPPRAGRPGYCLSICSANFNDWVRKTASGSDGYSYVFTQEFEMFDWNVGHLANYAELSYLIAPRPFMVERGHADGVAPDEWVAWEYAKVRRHYAQLGLADKTEIAFFQGGHVIHGTATYEFLHRHLHWPPPRKTGP